MKPMSTPKLALDWGLNNSLAGILNTLFNLIANLFEPITNIIELIAGLFTGDDGED